MWKQSFPLDFSREDVVAVWLEPIPEGPQSPRFVMEPRDGDRSLTLITDAIPSTLPRDIWQGFTCNMGGNVVVEVRDGDPIRYGPCRRPDAIENLRQEMLAALDP